MSVKRCVLDGSSLDSFASIFAALAEQLEFPDWARPNRDALWDLLMIEIAGPIEIVWREWQQSERQLGSEFAGIHSLLTNVAAEREDFSLCLPRAASATDLIEIDSLDHLVLTVVDIGATCRFYCDVLGFAEITFGGGRKALRCGSQKINLHVCGQELEPKAERPVPGSADLCFITTAPIAVVVERLQAHSVLVLEGPVLRTGAMGPIDSVYCRDPDGNLIEIAKYR